MARHSFFIQQDHIMDSLGLRGTVEEMFHLGLAYEYVVSHIRSSALAVLTFSLSTSPYSVSSKERVSVCSRQDRIDRAIY